MNMCSVKSDFWKNRRILLTGHTGFKGAWTALWLEKMGAEVIGVSLPPEGDFSLYGSVEDHTAFRSHFIDIRNRTELDEVVSSENPEIVLHMAAQALVRRSYKEPVLTYETNVLGTVNLLDSLSRTSSVKAALIVTSDKVYANNNSGRPFVETDELGGDDPYSSSKAACEIATASLSKSLFKDKTIPIATARAGNVIGGGDFSEDRLIPDIWRAACDGKPVTLRYPNATRPWQHVLESVSGYLTYLQALCEDADNKLPRALNFGPAAAETFTVGQIANQVQEAFDIKSDWLLNKTEQPVEKTALALDAGLAKNALGWESKWQAEKTLDMTVDWYKAFSDGRNAFELTLSQIEDYEKETA
ncbi:CDP-glucose 4,6-dehydratase [Sneathiella marina]|uniref:CDP-glucose 4,6-dehydratase n=1 Tax=Sneathiella marina TaxID=2950108 RepID=A0ABY4W048_9PROT|nr:CDP-glucose 4,6-dehydratase [Sneathiella marina]USG60339.1 CDP-glucose 4,6-dehydratase [Sneathiella marina]